ncbi:MAG TPA: glutaredoxin family protein [Candidatus Saccharimonadales bacterium]
MTDEAKVIVYSADWCGFCHTAMGYLDKIGVKYIEKNIEHDPVYAKESIQKSNQTGIPVIDIDGTVIVGFDRPRIDAALKDKKLV